MALEIEITVRGTDGQGGSFMINRKRDVTTGNAKFYATEFHKKANPLIRSITDDLEKLCGAEFAEQG